MREKNNISLFSYMGSKAPMAERIADLLDDTKACYCEPFAGSAAVFLNKLPSSEEILNDKDIGIFALWTEAKEDIERLFAEYFKIPQCKEIFSSFLLKKRAGYPGVSLHEKAVMELYIIEESFNSARLNFRACDRSKLENQIFEIEEYINERLQNVVIKNDDALDILRKNLNNEDMCIYLDPPYLDSLISRPLYFERLGDEEQINMLSMIQNCCKCSILLSGYRGNQENGFLYDQYLNVEHGWACYVVDDRQQRCCSNNAECMIRGARKRFSTEVVWCNYVPDAYALGKLASFDIAMTEKEAKGLA